MKKPTPHNVGLKMKTLNISMDNTVIRKALPKNKKKWNGLKKGSGQLPGTMSFNHFGVGVGISSGDGMGSGDGGVGETVLSFAQSLLQLLEDTESNGLEDITSERPVTRQSDGEIPNDNPDDAVDVDGQDDEGEGTVRYVKNAHLVYKREIETGHFDELWIYTIDPNTTEPTNTPLNAILAGTDIPKNAIKSDDGSQSYVLWTAGNAQFVHISGLPN